MEDVSGHDQGWLQPSFPWSLLTALVLPGLHAAALGTETPSKSWLCVP